MKETKPTTNPMQPMMSQPQTTLELEKESKIKQLEYRKELEELDYRTKKLNHEIELEKITLEHKKRMIILNEELDCLNKMTINYDEKYSKLKSKISDEDYDDLLNLHRLNLGGNTNVTDDDIIELTDLEELVLWNNDRITNVGISKMNLKFLDLGFNNLITMNGIKHMSKLKVLIANKKIDTEEIIKYSPNCSIRVI